MLSELIVKLALTLEAEKIDYMLIGGQAMLAYREPRLTKDIDITVDLDPKELPRLISVLKKAGIKILSKEPERFVERTMVLPCISAKAGFRVDIIFANSQYEAQALRRARKIKVGRTPVKFASLEDIIILKMFAARPRDIEDVKKLVSKKSKLDLDYIREWLSQIDSDLSTNHRGEFERLIEKR